MTDLTEPTIRRGLPRWAWWLAMLPSAAFGVVGLVMLVDSMMFNRSAERLTSPGAPAISVVSTGRRCGSPDARVSSLPAAISRLSTAIGDRHGN